MSDMFFWILVVLLLSLQENFSCSWLITKAYQQDHYNLVYLSLIFIVTTTIQIVFFSSEKFYGKIRRSRFASWVKRSSIMSKAGKHAFSIIGRINSIAGTKEKKIFLAYLSATVSPAWFNSMISHWLNLTAKQIFLPVFAGVVFWYLTIVLTVAGVNYFTENANTAMMIILGLSFVYVLLQRILAKRLNRY